jgi:hypothetical protein
MSFIGFSANGLHSLLLEPFTISSWIKFCPGEILFLEFFLLV